MRSIVYSLIFSISIFIFATHIVHAQSSSLESYATDQVTVSMTPQYPRPGDTVTITLQAYSLDIDRATITWAENNKIIKKAVGEKTFTMKAGAAGTQRVINIVIETPYTQIEKAITIAPADIDIIWQADGYVPPFFEGKAHYVYQGTMSLTALPQIYQNGALVDPKNLVYKWEQDGDPISNTGGTGKNSIRIKGGLILGEINIRVIASTPDNQISAARNFTITPESPLILFYENNPLYGLLYNHAYLSDITLKRSEITLQAVPYYFTVSPYQKYDLSNNIAFSWTQNNKDIQGLKDSITVRQQKGTTGTSKLSVSIKNTSKSLQFSSRNLTVSFTSP